MNSKKQNSCVNWIMSLELIRTSLNDVKQMNKRQILYQILQLAMVLFTALMIWKGLMIATGSDSPIVVVLSGSIAALVLGEHRVQSEDAVHSVESLIVTNSDVPGKQHSVTL